MSKQLSEAIQCTHVTGKWQCGRMTRDPRGLCSMHVHLRPAHVTPDTVARGAALSSPIPNAARITTQVDTTGSRIEARPYQNEAVAAVFSELRDRDRCQVRAACGMGKTVIAQRIIQEDFRDGEESTGIYVVVTSNIRLVRQLRADFENDGIVSGMSSFSVHHGSEDLQKARKAMPGSSPESADVAALTEFLEQPTTGPKVVFVTYDSVHKVALAQQDLGDEGRASITVLDEAHNLGGEYGKQRRPASDDDLDASTGLSDGSYTQVPRVFYDEVPGSVRSRSRVFMSATPIAPTEAERASSMEGYTAPVLSRIAAREDAGEPAVPVRLYNTDPNLFGRPAFSRGLTYAVSQKALVPLRAEVVGVRVEEASDHLTVEGRPASPGVKGSMSRSAYVATVSTLESLAAGDGHNVLTFLPRIADAEQVSANWRNVALSLVGPHAPSVSEAENILRTGRGDQRSARMVMLAEHASTVAASSNSTEAARSAAYAHFDSAVVGDSGCGCGRPGGWCACARVVSNVDLFGEGVSISSVDTVVIADRAKTGDVPLTQAVGRAMRRWDSGGKQYGRVIIPEVRTASNDRADTTLTSSLSYGVSRLSRDSIGSAIGNRRMESPDAAPFAVHTADGRVDINTYASSVMQPPIEAALTVTAYERLYSSTRAAHTNRIPKPEVAWNRLLPSERHDAVLTYARAPEDDAVRVEADHIRSSMPDLETVRTAQATVELMRRKIRRYDSAALSEEERSVARVLGISSGRRRGQAFGTRGRMGALSSLSAPDGAYSYPGR